MNKYDDLMDDLGLMYDEMEDAFITVLGNFIIIVSYEAYEKLITERCNRRIKDVTLVTWTEIEIPKSKKFDVWVACEDNVHDLATDLIPAVLSHVVFIPSKYSEMKMYQCELKLKNK